MVDQLRLRDWQQMCQAKALEYAGTPEGNVALAESKRYGLAADRVEELTAQIEAMRNALASEIPLVAESVLSYLYALDDEAKQRGSMFPQVADEHASDSNAIHRVADMVRWYAENGSGYPEMSAVKALMATRALMTQKPAPSFLAFASHGDSAEILSRRDARTMRADADYVREMRDGIGVVSQAASYCKSVLDQVERNIRNRADALEKAHGETEPREQQS